MLLRLRCGLLLLLLRLLRLGSAGVGSTADRHGRRHAVLRGWAAGRGVTGGEEGPGAVQAGERARPRTLAPLTPVPGGLRAARERNGSRARARGDALRLALLGRPSKCPVLGPNLPPKGPEQKTEQTRIWKG